MELPYNGFVIMNTEYNKTQMCCLVLHIYNNLEIIPMDNGFYCIIVCLMSYFINKLLSRVQERVTLNIPVYYSQNHQITTDNDMKEPDILRGKIVSAMKNIKT